MVISLDSLKKKLNKMQAFTASKIISCYEVLNSYTHPLDMYSKGTKTLFLNTLQNVHLRKWLLLMITQKLLIAYSFYCLHVLEKNMQQKNNNGISECKPVIDNIYDILSVILPLSLSTIPGVYAGTNLKLLQKKSLKHYKNEFVKIHSKKSFLFNNKRYKMEREPYIIGGVGNNAVSESVEYFCSLADSVFSIALETTLIKTMSPKKNIENSSLLDPNLVLFFVISASYLYSKHYFHDAFEKSTQAKHNFAKAQMSAWDNITISNEYTLIKWEDNFSNTLKQHKKTSYEADFLLRMCSVVLTQMTILPLLYFSYSTEGLRLSTLAVNSKMQKSWHEFFNLTLRWNVFLAYVKSVNNSLKDIPLRDEDYLQHIKFRAIQKLDKKNKTALRHDTAEKFCDHIKFLQENRCPTRITLRAKNASGKSMLFCYIKDKLENKALLIPAQSKLSFSNNANTGCVENSESSGQAILTQYLTIANEKLYKNKVILADEWDANLDDNNVQIVDKMLDKISKKSVVLEIRHRH